MVRGDLLRSTFNGPPEKSPRFPAFFTFKFSSMKKIHYHVNPPQKGAKRATFTGVVEENTVFVGVANCSKNDQFHRAKGRLISTGRAINKPIFSFDIQDVEAKNVSDAFVQQCKQYANENGFITDYPRRRKKRKADFEQMEIPA